MRAKTLTFDNSYQEGVHSTPGSLLSSCSMDTACTIVLLTFWSLQEATSEFEVENMDGKTTDALTVRTRLFV